MTEIVHILIGVNGERSSVLTVLKFDTDLPAVKFLFKDDYERFETEAWVVKDENDFVSVKVTKLDLYQEGDDVLHVSENGEKLISSITYCDNDTSCGFDNVLLQSRISKNEWSTR